MVSSEAVGLHEQKAALGSTHVSQEQLKIGNLSSLVTSTAVIKIWCQQPESMEPTNQLVSTVQAGGGALI